MQQINLIIEDHEIDFSSAGGQTGRTNKSEKEAAKPVDGEETKEAAKAEFETAAQSEAKAEDGAEVKDAEAEKKRVEADKKRTEYDQKKAIIER